MEHVSLLQDCVMLTFTEEVMHKCLHFSCGDEDLNSFFTEDAFFYTEEMRAYVKTLKFLINSYTAYQYGRVTPASFCIRNISLHFITSAR